MCVHDSLIPEPTCSTGDIRTDCDSALRTPSRSQGPGSEVPCPPSPGGSPVRRWLSLLPLCPALFQWLKQIEGTEAALTQKMLDLEKEKVKAPSPGGKRLEELRRLAPMCCHVIPPCEFLLLLPGCVLGN